MTTFSNKQRSKIKNRLNSIEFDVVVVGGGITGAGIFLDATLRGLTCCLIEMQDFAEGTSSRSTKLIHGGLRYLKQYKFGLVAETGKERTVIANVSRHLTRPISLIVPTYKGGSFNNFQLKIAMWVYEYLANVPKSLKHRSFSTNELTESINGISKEGLKGGVSYTEYRTDDARLTIENIKSAVEAGGIAISKAQVLDVVFSGKDEITKVTVKDGITGEQIAVKSKCVINATGIWSEKLARAAKGKIPVKLTPTKGVHLVFSKEKLQVDQALYLDTPDKRMFFIIPNQDVVYVGTTDTHFNSDLANPKVEKTDIDYLLNACNSKFPDYNLVETDILSSWAGIRPLVKDKNNNPSEISRKHETYMHKNGMITIAGGKLTGYRQMAKSVVDIAIKKNFRNREFKTCSTENYLLVGSVFKDENDFRLQREKFINDAIEKGWNREEASWVYSLYGSESIKILNADLVECDLPDYLAQCLIYSLNHEMVISADDFLTRRTSISLFKPDVANQYKTEIKRLVLEFNNG